VARLVEVISASFDNKSRRASLDTLGMVDPGFVASGKGSGAVASYPAPT